MDTPLLSPLARKLLSGDIGIALQPIRRLTDIRSSPIGYEALLRMSDDDGRMIPPDQCLPTLEHTLGRSTVERRIIEIALARIAEYDRAFTTDPLPYYSLNISPSTLTAEGTVVWLVDRIRSAGLNPRRIVCELLETEPIGDIPAFSSTLREAHTEGLRIVLDDCTDTDGDHHAIATIGQVLDTIDGIKMDKSFVVSLLRVAQEQGEEHAGRYLLDILDRLRAAWQTRSIIYEGLETDAQIKMLRMLLARCGNEYIERSFVQGWATGRPFLIDTTKNPPR